jgi:hypothetical protein
MRPSATCQPHRSEKPALCPRETKSLAYVYYVAMPIFVLEPPSHYVHPYRGPVIERVLPLAEARRICASMGAPADACAWKSKGTCHLVIPRGGPVRNLSAYRRHELAHCNGWDHSR